MTQITLRNHNRNLPSLFDNMFNSDVFGRIIEPLAMFDDIVQHNTHYSPQIKVRDYEKYKEVSVGLPGVKKDELTVSVQDNMLTIACESNTEFSHSSFTRTWTLSKDLNSSEITAKYEDGVLTVSIPKVEESPTNVIEIQ